MSELHTLTITALAQMFRSDELSPAELTRYMLERIDAEDSRYHSYVTVLHDAAMAQAQRGEDELRNGTDRGPLHGIPLAVKDLCFTRNGPTSCGSQMMTNWIADSDATVIQRLTDAGAVILGKLHMTEFALRWHHPYRPIPVNPWGESLWPGVSSSGSGVATAAGLCFGALGTDTGGSIRFPAASCAVVGLKPTYGRVSRAGVFPLGASLDHVGPLTRSVADAAAILGVIAGYDSADPTGSLRPVPDYLATIDDGIQDVVMGVDESFISHETHPEVSRAVMAAVDQLVDLGAMVREVTVPVKEGFEDAWYTLTAAEAAAAHEGLYPERADEYGPFRELLEHGVNIKGQEYAQAHMVREEFSSRFNWLFETIDVLVCPTMPTPAPFMDAQGQPRDENGYNRRRYTYPFNFSRNPCLALPCGTSQDDRPMSMQLVARHFDEALLCRVGQAYEQAT